PLDQQLRKQLTPLSQAQRCELNREPTIIAIDHQAREAVRLAEDQPAGLTGPHQTQMLAKSNRGIDAIGEERSIDRLVCFPGIESDANLALAIEQSVRDEVPSAGEQLDRVPVGRVTFD